MLSRGMEAVLSLAGKDSTPPLEIKTDEVFLASCAEHGAALSQLSTVSAVGQRVATSCVASADAMIALGKAITALSTHERNNASAGVSAATAVASAAAQAKRSEQVLFAGVASSGTTDSAAAAAFASHTAAISDAGAPNDISSMFKADFNDPYSALHAAAAGGAGAPGGLYGAGSVLPPSSTAESIAQVLDVAGKAMVAAGSKSKDYQARVDAALLAFMAAERDKEAELAQAVGRRDAAVERVQEANRDLGRRKKTLAGLKPTEKDYNAKFTASQQAVAKSETALAQRQEDLTSMTELLKSEMKRVNQARRQNAAAHLAEHARVQAEQARLRAEAWTALLPLVTSDSSLLDKSREDVAAIARKAEARALASTGKGRSGSTASAADASASAGMTATSMPAFLTADLPMPSAADL